MLAIYSRNAKHTAFECCYLWRCVSLFCIRVSLLHDLFKILFKCTYLKTNEIRLRSLNSRIDAKVKQKCGCEKLCCAYSSNKFTIKYHFQREHRNRKHMGLETGHAPGA